MTGMQDTGVAADPAPGRASRTHRFRRLVATVTALLGLHLIPAAVMIPILTRLLRG